MDEKLEVEMLNVLRDLRDRLTSAASVRGPIADPGPDWFCHHHGGWPPFPPIRGDSGDPSPMLPLDKTRIAQLKLRQIEIAVTDLKQHLELLQLQQKLLKEEYKL